MLSHHKIAGACTLCDKQVYEVKEVQMTDDPFPGEPKKLGLPTEGTKVAFALYDGSHGDFTFCDNCIEKLNPDLYLPIWQKLMRSWIREIRGNFAPHSSWFVPQFYNGILFELGRIPLKGNTDV